MTTNNVVQLPTHRAAHANSTKVETEQGRALLVQGINAGGFGYVSLGYIGGGQELHLLLSSNEAEALYAALARRLMIRFDWMRADGLLPMLQRMASEGSADWRITGYGEMAGSVVPPACCTRSESRKIAV